MNVEIERPLPSERLCSADRTMGMLKLSCLCGQVRIEIPKRPDFINECNCTLCSKSGARWAYFHPSEVIVVGRTKGYSREDKEDPAAEIRFCVNCSLTTHFTLTASAVSKFGDVQMGVNMRLADEKDLAGIELRYPDGRAWSGKGAFGYVQGLGSLADGWVRNERFAMSAGRS